MAKSFLPLFLLEADEWLPTYGTSVAQIELMLQGHVATLPKLK
ncbi:MULTISPECIES: hypothetical protein [Vibrio]|uniref:Uncharacterized protein n=2 Tax=Vibrio cyclitrophicus TaxID=47951 RepID=A0ACD5G1V5_9VIBR|nr:MULTISPECIES: hypothetical protein [Vibrio]